MRNLFSNEVLEGTWFQMDSGRSDSASSLTPPPPLLTGAAGEMAIDPQARLPRKGELPSMQAFYLAVNREDWDAALGLLEENMRIGYGLVIPIEANI